MHNNRLTRSLVRSLAFFAFLPGAAAAEDLLLPDQAFQISGRADGPAAVVVEWKIVDGYYLYQSKFKFRSDSLGIGLESPEYPPAETRHDEFFGDVPIYRDHATIRIPIERAEGAADILTLQATSQGCADQGICYPPHSQTVLLALAPGTGPVAPKSVQSAPAAPAQGAALQALSDLQSELGLGAEDDEILPAEEAFRFSAEVSSGRELRLQWQVAEGTYLYSDKIRLALEDAHGVELGQIELPPATIKHDSIRPDGSVGDVAVYTTDFEVPVTLKRSTTDPTTIRLVSEFQGCADIGICYPPVKNKTDLTLPAIAHADPAPSEGASREASAAQAPAEPISEQDRIASMLAGGNTWAIIASFFGVGLLLAFTPCVFPMIPILSGIIAGQGRNMNARKAFILSVVYVLAMALTYTVAGVLAGLFGENLQAAFQNPWILSLFAAVFVLLALSMFGFYELQLPSSWQSKLTEISNQQQGGTLLGVAIMGLLSALIVGPCVAPPLAGALIYIGQTGDAVLGGLALFALSMGMGAPLVAIGTSAGKFLPRAGSWMDAVKAVFGVLMLGVAIFLLERILPAAIALLLWGGLLIVSAIYLGALKALPVEASGWSRLWQGLGVVILVYGTLMLVGAAAGGKDTLQPLRGILSGGAAETNGNPIRFQRVASVAELDAAVQSASNQGNPVLLDFYADWCITCKEMERYTFSDPAVQEVLRDFVLLQADVTENSENDQALLQGRFGLPGPPAIMFFDRDGNERKNYRVVGFMEAEQFATHARRAVQ